ncbi:MAG: hypothetical protein AAGF12_30265, partial [Myxococcota bacterium]
PLRRRSPPVFEVESRFPVTTTLWTVEGGGVIDNPRIPTTVFTPGAPGTQELMFTATDTMGTSASCTIQVETVVGPPVAICPEEELRTLPGEAIDIVGNAFDDDGIVATFWEVSGPGMAFLEPPDALETVFIADVPGTYTLELTVIDVDMATDTCTVPVRVMAPPVVTCPPDQRVPTRQEVVLVATAVDETVVVSVQWEVVDRPRESVAMPIPANQERTSFTPDKKGPYRLRFTAVDEDGMTGSCEVNLDTIPTPPEIMCPPTTDTTPLTPTPLAVTAIDDGFALRYEWSLVSTPLGSAAAPPTPADAPNTTFTPDIAGIYELEVRVIDDDNMSSSCRFMVRALATEGLRVEMFWDTRSDMDTHLNRPEGTRWFNNDDCHFSNCNEMSGDVLEWGMPGLDDNPRLDLDNTSGFGPENINIDRPYAGSYRVGVRAFSGQASVTVRIYCGGSTTMPRATFGPVRINSFAGSRDFWRVADVDINNAGGCTVTELQNMAGQPDVRPENTAQTAR